MLIYDPGQKLDPKFKGMVAAWSKPEDNELGIITFVGERCCAGTPGDYYPWSDQVIEIDTGRLGSFRVVDVDNLTLGKDGEDYNCYEEDE